VSTAYQIQENLLLYGAPFWTQLHTQGAPVKITKAAEESSIKYIEEQPWALQEEMAWLLWEVWGLSVHFEQ
jgi:hypothetical protein